MKRVLYLLLAVTMVLGVVIVPTTAAPTVTDFDIDFFGFENDTFTMEAGRKYQLSPVFYPAGATGTVTYEEERPSIAYVDGNGVLVALSQGTTKITATCNGISKELTVVVNVTGPAYDATKAVVPGTPDFLGTSNRDEDYTPPETISIGNRNYKLSFFDNFQGTTLSKRWNHSPEWQRKNKPGWWRDEAAYLDGNGLLVIDNYVTDFDPTLSNASKFEGLYDYAFASGALDTKRGIRTEEYGFEQAYGYWEICCAVPRVTGYWPSFWLLNDKIGLNDDGGRYGCEIDIFEAMAVTNTVDHTIHWNGYTATQNIHGAKSYQDFFSKGYHTVGLEWTEDMYIFYVDGYETWRSNQGTADPDYQYMNICEEPLYINICCEFGVTAGEDQFDLYPSAYLVDYVRVYDLTTQDGDVSTEKEEYNNGITDVVVPEVKATGVKVNCDDVVYLQAGQVVQIFAETIPVNAQLDTTRGKLKYSSSNTAAFKVDNTTGAVTAIAEGSGIYTVTASKDGTIFKKVAVVVGDAEVPTIPSTPDPVPTEPITTPTTAPTSAPIDPTILYGDVNDDGVVNIIDGLQLFKYTAGTLTSLANSAAADLDGNQTVNVADAMKLYSYIAGKITTLA